MRSLGTEPVESSESATAWGPLRHGVFRMLWTAWLSANLCMWMNDVAAAWLMTTLSGNPVLVALVQTASTLPVFLLALPSGAMADIVDRRQWLMSTQLWVAVVATLLACAAWAGALSAPVLLLLVFANGIGLAMRWPVFVALIPEILPRHELAQALALHSVAVNASRIIGPVIAGTLLASFGSTHVFLLNAMLSLGTAALIWRWRYARPVTGLPGERFLAAMRVGIQYVARSGPLRLVLSRTFIFFLQSSALLALAPLVAKGLGAGDAGMYAILLACMGVGAIAAALWMPRVRERFDRDAVLNAGTVLHAVATVIAAWASQPWVACIAMFPAGASWIAVANSLTVSAQLALPDWVRARGMSVFLMSVTAGSAIGAALWGAVVSYIGLRDGLLLSSAAAMALLILVRHRGVA